MKAGSLGTGVTGSSCRELEAWLTAGVAYGSNSDRSAGARTEGVAEDAGVFKGRSLAGALGCGASGATPRTAGAGVVGTVTCSDPVGT